MPKEVMTFEMGHVTGFVPIGRHDHGLDLEVGGIHRLAANLTGTELVRSSTPAADPVAVWAIDGSVLSAALFEISLDRHISTITQIWY